jgi:flagella basal body P-ring formation protein FlgA
MRAVQETGLMRSSCFILAALAVSWPAASATLRAGATLDRPQVRVADLFDDAGPAASRVLGPGPAPGARMVVEAAQLQAIARQFGVEWRAASSGDRIVIDRPGQMVVREDVVAALRAALVSAGAAADGELELPAFQAPIVSLAAQPRCAVEQMDYDQPSGRFTATLAVITTDAGVQRQRLSGRLVEMTEVYVPARRILAGEVIKPGDLVVARVRSLPSRAEVVREPARALGMAARHMLVAGQPVLVGDLARPVLVQRNARVVMRLQTAGLQLSASGTAMESGGLGDRILVMNPSSRAVVEAEITGADQVRVMPDTTPRSVTQNMQVTSR